MVDRLVAVDDANYRLPEPVLGALAGDLGASGTVVGDAVETRFSVFNPAGLIDTAGTVDSSAAFQAFLDSVPEGVTVTTPPGALIKLSSLITLTKPVHIDGNGATFHTTGTNGMFAIPEAASGSSFRNMHLQGVSPTTYAAANKAFNVTGAPGAWVADLRFEDVSVDGFGYGGFFGSHTRDTVTRNCKVTNCVYVGFQFLSPNNVVHHNPYVDTLHGIAANGYMQSYPIAWTRDQTKASIVDYPNAQDCTTWGGTIQNAGWEGVDTHGGRNIRTIGTNIYDCMIGIAYVPCPNESGVDMWGPQDCAALYCNIDSRATDASHAVGIKLIGAGNTGNRTEAATGVIVGNKIKGHGRGTTTTGGTGDPSTVGGAIQLYQTDSVRIDLNEIDEPNPFGIALWYDNTNCQIGTNTVTDPWSDTFAAPAAIAIRSTGNSVSIGATKLIRGSKSAVNVAKVGLYVSNNTKNTAELVGGTNFDVADTPFSGGGTGLITAVTLGVRQGAGTGAPNVGVWRRGSQWWNTNAAASGSPGWVNTVTGGSSSATWAASTAYAAGTWARLSTGQVAECVVAGTSSATEPTLTTIGAATTDGTVTWEYRAATSASWKQMAALGA